MTEPPDRSTAIAVHPGQGLVRVTLSGRYDLRGWLDVIQAVGQEKDYLPGMDALYDATDAHFDFSTDDVRILAEWATERLDTWGSGWRYATVVSNDVMENLSRTVAAWFDDAPFEAGVFRSLEDAVAWIRRGRKGGEAPDG